MSQVSEQQISEWLQSPVSKELVKRIEIYRDHLDSSKGLSAFHPFEPQRTQEVLANLNGAVDTWEDVIDILEGNWELIDVSDDVETEGSE